MKRKTLWILPVLAVLAVPSAAHADDTIKHPGDHPTYVVEAEPHLVFAFDNVFGGQGFGLGGRVTFPIVQNGFIPSINNSVGVGVGLDLVHYTACYFGQLCGATYAWVPVVMQWNFFVAQQWSVFGEPGVAFYHGFGVDNCPPGVNGCNGPSTTALYPVVLFVGGRYHFSEDVSLTMRIGWPMFTIGVSFFP
jgi:hypothetical protein